MALRGSSHAPMTRASRSRPPSTAAPEPRSYSRATGVFVCGPGISSHHHDVSGRTGSGPQTMISSIPSSPSQGVELISRS
ncbi:hypothetical protein BJF77_01260 [Kocuria sp. CNJ-770]|nr:hypothetical protein BJF77_01260 [Kocuria sp. CNJ-770]